ncbi:MAG: aminomethyl-transferring glycine dehydrogenase subunit GcvPA [Candidatus Cloacimonetes bacterium]|nr:aminomethyl-transferring glycine dehydrogenase subunit GcvPA [Candidatus Cloacimonadota bacterium]MDY0173503.1 aminomethyl-transferring glycine dehydrogenase subunit GcvPA [Candidatus Cloacimonadaceae bacterium]
MPYISNTDRDRREMLDKIGVKDFDELIHAIPKKFRVKDGLKLDKAMSELEITNKIKSQTCKNLSCGSVNSFLGAGVYDHFIPAAVDSIVSRPEFYTAYTPYQAEVSQGTLQYIYEYQTMICELTGMEIANASMYDGASAVAEAILMAVRKNKREKAILPATLNPEFVKVIKSYTEGVGIELLTVPSAGGVIDLQALKGMMDDTIGSVVLQSPNYFGNLEDTQAISKVVHSSEGCLLIAAVDPISLTILNAPAEYDADIVVGEGQALGNSMYMGGPLFGFFATKLNMARQMPGRIVGGTLDVDGKRAFALTLQAREQHIRRAKATSNICSNQSLCTLAATVYMSLMGREGLKEVAIQSAQKAHYLADELAKIPGISLKYPAPFFKEFVITTPVPAAEIIEKMVPKGIYAGVKVGKNELMIAVTEKKQKTEMDEYVKAMQEVCNV